jgi:hypothetical protein
MATPTKTQLKKIAFMHSAGVLMATESLIAFSGSGLTNDEMAYIDKTINKIALKLLNGNTPIFDANEIVNKVLSE